jgi:hypothetical protein
LLVSTFTRLQLTAYAVLANGLVAEIRPRSGPDNWTINFVGKALSFQFDGEPKGIHPSLWIWFFAAARDEFIAFQSRATDGRCF